MKYINAPEYNIEYKRRIGAYGLLTNDVNQIAVIHTSTGYFLPGGGWEDGESLETCLIREFKEEVALEVRVNRKLSEISFYFYSTSMACHMISEGHFYHCHALGPVEGPGEEDYTMVWMTLEEAKDKLYLDNQKTAVWEFMKSMEV